MFATSHVPFVNADMHTSTHMHKSGHFLSRSRSIGRGLLVMGWGGVSASLKMLCVSPGMEGDLTVSRAEKWASQVASAVSSFFTFYIFFFLELLHIFVVFKGHVVLVISSI